MWIPRQPLDLGPGEAHFSAMTQVTSSAESAAAQVRGYVWAVLMVAAATLLGLVIAPRWGNSGVDLLYLPAVLAAASFAGLGPALLAALASALAYNFFFTAPHLTFQIDNPNDIVTVLVLFAVAVVTSQLAASVRRQARRADANAARNATIAGLARRLLACTSAREIGEVAMAEIGTVFACNAVLVLADTPAPAQFTPADIAAAALVFEKGEPAGRGVDRAVPTE
jgi:two-component system sensor histidine kinase KdpD